MRGYLVPVCIPIQDILPVPVGTERNGTESLTLDGTLSFLLQELVEEFHNHKLDHMYREANQCVVSLVMIGIQQASTFVLKRKIRIYT